MLKFHLCVCNELCIYYHVPVFLFFCAIILLEVFFVI